MRNVLPSPRKIIVSEGQIGNPRPSFFKATLVTTERLLYPYCETTKNHTLKENGSLKARFIAA